MFRWRLCSIAGAILAVTALCRYESDTKAVFGRWSYSWVGVILATATAAAVWAFMALRQGRSRTRATPLFRVFELAVLANGLSFHMVMVGRSHAAVGLDPSLWGGITPWGALAGWLGMVFAFLLAGFWMAPRLPARLMNPALVAASICALLLAGEAVARLHVFLSPAMEGFGALPSAVWRRRHVEINSDGFRDVAHPLQPAAAEKRVLVVGDSFAFGWGLPEVETRFGERLARALGSRTGDRWAAINAGWPGTNTIQHRRFLERMLKYRPDLVILLYVFNDIEYLYDDPPAMGSRPPLRTLLVNSYLADWLYDRLRVVSYAFAGRSSVAFGAGDGNSNPYRQPELLRRHLSDIRRFVEAGSRQGAVVTIVPFDPDVKIAGTLAGRYQHFVEALRREGIPFLDAADALHPYEYRELILSPRDPHPSALANQAMAEQVAQRLVESGSSVVASPTRVGRESNGASAAQPRTLR